MRAHTSLGYYPEHNMDYIDTDTKVAEDVLTPGFGKYLEDFYLKAASAEDRARCLELLTSLDLGKAIKQDPARVPHPSPPRAPKPPPLGYRPHRPRTAMAEISPNDPDDAYRTSYVRDYPTHPEAPANAQRPATTCWAYKASHDLSGPIGGTTYQNEFYNKPQKIAGAIRTGSSSGNRRNNPHPPEAFMVWKLSGKRKEEQPYSEWSHQLTDEDMDRVCRGKLTSTYQQDYLGIPQGMQVQSAFSEKEDWKSRIPFTLDSSMRDSFRIPDQKPEFKGNNTRYGCNKHKYMAASGVVPTTSTRQMNIKTKTTYEREFIDSVGPRAMDVRDFGRQLGARAIGKNMHKSRPADRPMLQQVMAVMDPAAARAVQDGFLNSSRATSSDRSAPCIRTPFSRTPSSRGADSSCRGRYRPSVPPATCLDTPPDSTTPSQAAAL